MDILKHQHQSGSMRIGTLTRVQTSCSIQDCSPVSITGMAVLSAPGLLTLRDGPSKLLDLSDDDIWELDGATGGIPRALQMLADAAGAASVVPGVNCGGVFLAPARPELPSGEATCCSPYVHVTIIWQCGVND